MAVALCAGLTACGGNKTVDQLTNELGALLEGGNFKEGSVLNLNKIEMTEEKATEILGKLEDNGITIDDESKAYIYDIFVTKDDAEVQPDGTVKVTIPAPADEKAEGYNVYHIKDNGVIESIPATYADGKVTFETDSFSVHILVPTYNFVNFTYKGELYVGATHLDYGKILCNGQELTEEDPKLLKGTYLFGEDVTLEVEVTEKNYTFLGWYEAESYYLGNYAKPILKDTPVSTEKTYTFNKEEFEYAVYAVFSDEGQTVSFGTLPQDGGTIKVNGEVAEGVYLDAFQVGKTYALEAVAKEGYRFVGWDISGALGYETVTDASFSLVTGADTRQVLAKFEPVVTDIVVDLDYTIVYDPNLTTDLPNFENVVVSAVTVEGTTKLWAGDYTVDLGGLDETKPGTYTVTYTCVENTDVKTTVNVVVLKESVKITVENYGWGGHTDVLGEILVEKGEEITLNAYLDDEERYIFSGWYVNDLDTRVAGAMEYTFTATEDTTVIARFEKNTKVDLSVNVTCMGEGNISDKVDILVDGVLLKEETMEEITGRLHVGRTIHLEAVDREGNYRFVGWYVAAEDGEPFYGIYNKPASKENFYRHRITDNSISLIALFANDDIHCNALVAGEEITAELLVNGENVGRSAGLRLGETYTFDVDLGEDFRFLYWEVQELNRSYRVEEQSFTYEVIPGSRNVIAVCEPIFVDMKTLYDQKSFALVVGDDVFTALKTLDIILFKPSGNYIWSNYGETHTIDFKDLDASTEGTYVITYRCLANPDLFVDVTVHMISSEIEFNAVTNSGTLIKDGEEIGPDYYEIFADAYGKVTLTAKGEENMLFKGWYMVDGDTTTLLSTEETFTFELGSDMSVYAEFEPAVTDLIVDMDDVIYDPNLLTQYTLISIPEFIEICREGESGENWNTEYVVVGTIASIEMTYWGNMRIVDADGNKLHLYGVYDENGTRFGLLPNKPRVGDTIVVHGTPYLYNNHPEMQKAYLLNAMPVLPDFENVTVSSVTVAGTTKLSADEFTVDASAVNLAKPGEYEVVYTYKANPEIRATVTVKVIATPVYLNAWVNDGTILIDGVDIGPDYFEEFVDGFGQVTLTAQGEENAVFKGWYEIRDNENVLVSTDETYTFVFDSNTTVYAQYEYAVTELYLEVTGAGFNGNSMFTDIYLPYNGPVLNPEEITVYGIANGEPRVLDRDEYTIETGLDFDLLQPNDHVIHVIYNANPDVFAIHVVRILDSEALVNLELSVDAGGRIRDEHLHTVYNKGSQISLSFVLRSAEDYEFLGWYSVAEDGSETLLSTDADYFPYLNESMKIHCRIEPRITRLEVEGYEGEPTRVHLEKFWLADREIRVYACGALGKRIELTADEYTVDMGGLDLANPVVGKYIITYTYTADTSITYSVTVWVWEKDHSFYATQDSPDNGWLIFEGEFTHEAGGQFVDGEEITVTAVAKEGYIFLGWYLVIDHETHAEYELISPDYSYTFILNKDVKLEAKFGAPVTEITLGDAAPITVYQGERVDLSHVGVWSHSIIESRNLNADEYTVDLGGLDLDNPIAGVYTVTFTYNENPDLKATLTVTVLKQSYYIEVGGVGDLFAYNGKTTDYLLEYLEEGTEIRLQAIGTDPYKRVFVAWNVFNYETGEWELYSTDEEILIVVDGKMMLRPVFNYVIEEVKMYVMNSFELRAAGLQHWNFDDTGYWDEGLGHYVAQSNMEIYEDSIYANDMESLFGLFHIVAMDANGNRRVIEARELTVDLGDYEAEEGWYQITVSYGTFTRIIDVVVLPARNA
jgi:hypothetical protein